MNIVKELSLATAALVVFAFVALADADSAFAANPCGAGSNPCAAKNPKVDARLVTRPAGTQLARGDHAELVKEGKKLFNDVSLGTNDISCQTCHEDNGLFRATFAKPYPHRVAMAISRGGIKSINLDEMIQFCILVPMAGKPLPWDSRELAALTAYTASLQKNFSADAGAANPCAAKNPCSAK